MKYQKYYLHIFLMKIGVINICDELSRIANYGGKSVK